MPIAKVPPKKPENPVEQPVIKGPDVLNEVVDTRYTPRKSLMTYVEGSSWLVDFYQQVLAPGSEPMALQHDEQNTTQQYRRIRRTIIKVSTDLQHNPEKDQGQMEVTGAGFLMPGIIPNQGDMFVADIGDGRAGVFTINDVEIMSIYNDTAYQITYEMTDFWDTSIQKLFDDKTVESAVYDLDYARTGMNPIIASNEFFNREKLIGTETSLIEHFFSKFFDGEYDTFTVPDQLRSTYDPYFVRFVDKLIDYEQRPSRQRVWQFDESLKGYQRPVTIWDMLVGQDPHQFKYVTRQMQVVPTTYFRSATALYGGVAYSGFFNVLYPVNDNIVVNLDVGIPTTPIDPRLFKEISVYKTYVLSEAFYDQKPAEMTELERQVYNLITGAPINVDTVMDLIDAYFNSTGIVQYYAFPLLVCLCRTARYRL
jgi:hypothetical protein